MAKRKAARREAQQNAPKSRRPKRTAKRPLEGGPAAGRAARRETARNGARVAKAGAPAGRPQTAVAETRRDTAARPDDSTLRRRSGRRPRARSRPANAGRNLPTPPSSLDMDRHGSAARTGRAEIAENLRDHRSMTPPSPGATSTSTSRTPTSPARKRPAATTPRPIRTWWTISARRWAWNTTTTRS